MRLLSTILFLFLSYAAASATAKEAAQGTVPQSQAAQDTPTVSEAAFKQWHADKYSMFIHFGLYSELGGVWEGKPVTRGYSEQIQSHGGIFSDEYEAVAESFNPTAFNADEIVALAKTAGMRSVIITGKHHDGFCLWRTATTGFNSWEATPSPRDFIKELSDACKKAGLRFGLYFSLIDWHFPQAYPISSSNADPITPEHHTLNLNQVRELLTLYGPISELWFDMGSLTPDQSRELYLLVHTLQPDCMVSGRLGNDQYDFCVMADNSFPEGTLKTAWQTPASMFDETWGYRSWQERGDAEVKAAEKLRSLAGVVSHGGNYLLNIGPKGDGSIVGFERDVLLKIGKWLQENSEAIYGTEAFEWPGLEEKIFTTRKGNDIFIIPSDVSEDTTIILPLGSARLKSATTLSTGKRAVATVKSGKLRLTVPATGKSDFMEVIRLTFDKPITEAHSIIRPSKSGTILLSCKNAIQSNSYSCFDYYSNYKSITGYEWNVAGVSGNSLEITYTGEHIGKSITLEVDGRQYPVTLNGEDESTLETAGLQWGPTCYSIRRGSFRRDLPAKIYNLSTPEWSAAESDALEKVSLNSTVYIAREVTAEQDCEQIIGFAAGSGVELLVNGHQVLKHLNAYGTERRDEFAKISLTKGRNQILIGTFNKTARTIPLCIRPAENKLYKTTVRLDYVIRRGAVHTIKLGPAAGYNTHKDIELSDVEIRIK